MKMEDGIHLEQNLTVHREAEAVSGTRWVASGRHRLVTVTHAFGLQCAEGFYSIK